MQFEQEHRPPPAINLVPILDSIFILVFVFMFGLLNLSKKQGLNLNLPQAVSATPIKLPQKLVIELTADQRIIFQSRSMNFNELKTELEYLSLEMPNKALVIKGDKDSPLGQTIRILDMIKKYGFNNVRIETANN